MIRVQGGLKMNEFRKTVRKINDRARQIGTEADYDEKWGD
jgi:hypothetical protein